MACKISIIVPVYNVEGYLHKCIVSILNQTFKEFELILVDDGSSDNCGKICDLYAYKDERIKVIHKKNGGLSSARNAGLALASCEYIVFIDSDDFVESTLLEECICYMDQMQVDIVVFEWNAIYKERIVKETKNKDYFENTDTAVNAILFDKVPNYVWNKFYKRFLWNDISFPLNSNMEDLVVMPEVFMRAKTIGYLNKHLYNYNCVNFNSISSSVNAKNKYGIFLGFRNRYQIALEYGIRELLVLSKKRAIESAVTAYSLNMVQNSLAYEQVELLKEYVANEKDFSDIGIKYRILAYGCLNSDFICRCYGHIMVFSNKFKRSFKMRN